MNAAQGHRGPDGRGVWEDPLRDVALGHVRLAILDLTPSAAQPMASRDGADVLVYNGEIYNFKELREELRGEGCEFHSTGDTEVLLEGLRRHGTDFLSRLNGMFAFGLWRERGAELLLARDPAGIKPLYYVEPTPGVLLFASEMKALCAHPGVKREVDEEALTQHLAFGHTSGSRTAMRGIRRLAPGHLLRWRHGTRTLIVERYGRPRFGPPLRAGRAAVVEDLRRRLQAATVRQLVSDVPVGAFLSGGLDSTLLTTLATREGGSDFRCYTIDYAAGDNLLDQVDPDAPHARRVAERLGLRLRVEVVRPNVVDVWPRLVHHLDEPLADPAAISCHLVCAAARADGVPVLLSGQGADELFGGYPRYPAMEAMRLLDLLPPGFRRGASRASRALPGAREGAVGAWARRTRRLLGGLAHRPDRRFLTYCSNSPDWAVRGVLSEGVSAQLAGRAYWSECEEHLRARRLPFGSRYLERDQSVYLANHNLLYTDKMGMAVGLEARVPFLDRDVVELANRIPFRWKVRGRHTKMILRDAARGLVPEDILRRRKAGFGAPYRKWLRYDLAEMWNDLCGDVALRARGWFDPETVRRVRERSQSGEEDLYMLQWAILTLEVWARAFLDRNPAEEAGCGTPSSSASQVGGSA